MSVIACYQHLSCDTFPEMLTTAVVENNKASWLDVLQFVDEFPENETWAAWKAFVRPVIEACIEAGLHQYFRAGTSMQHIIFSTSERHGLEEIIPSPPRVTFGRRTSASMVVAWSHRNLWFHDPEREDAVTSENAMSVLMHYLADLWRETRPADPVPFGI